LEEVKYILLIKVLVGAAKRASILNQTEAFAANERILQRRKRKWELV